MIKSLFSLFALFLCLQVSAQLLISEVAPTNTSQLADADGDYPDWIEIYNAGQQTADLEGVGLGDGNRPKWNLPAFSLGAGQRLVLFASGKNRGAQNGPSVDHWETAVNEGDTWHTFVGTSAPPSDWASVDFDESAWVGAPGPFGYGDGDDVTEVPAGTLSFYYRRDFTVADLSLLDSAILSMDYDDGFIAYLNGTEIARSGNMPPGPADYTTVTTVDHEALMYGGGVPDIYSISNARLDDLLHSGRNVLAIELHNIEPASSDLSGRTWLHFGIHTSQVIYGPNPPFFNSIGTGSGFFHTNFKIGFGESVYLFDAAGNELDHIDIPYLQPGHSLMRIDDAGDWCITNTPTPDAPNGNSCFPGYAGAPTISPAAGFYATSQEITLTGTNVRYTTNGSEPDETSLLYTGPFTVDATTVVRARIFETGLLPGNVVTATYFINESTYLPVLSISATPGDLFNDGSGGPAVYDNYNSGLKAPVQIEYFDKGKHLVFAEKASLRPVGGYSIAFDQKSMQFSFDEEYGASNEVQFPLFSKDKPGISSIREFRVRNMDDDWSSTRMRDVVANRLALPTHCAATAYQHMAVFINGEYWGHYGGREVTNEYYVRDNHGADKDQVDEIFSSYFLDEDYFVEDGSGDAFYDMADFIIQNDMSDPALFAQAQDLVDWKNWVDYFAAEMYLANGDWFSSMYFNNTRMYHAPGVPWRYVMFDMTYAQNNGTNAGTNILYEALGNPYYPNLYTDMMNSLLENPFFHNYFINRFADLMNVYFTTSKAIEIIDDNITEIASEIPNQSARWGSAGTLDWINSVTYLKNFHRDRPEYQRQQIQDYFGLNGQSEITLDVQPAGAGVIKISTIIPESFPWSGIYFDGNPVTITAIPNPGFTFDHWTSALPIDPLASTLEVNLSGTPLLRAHFTGSAAATTLEVTEVNYHSDPTTDTGDWFEIRNTGSFPIDISDYTFQDREWYHAYVAPTGTVLEPNENLVLVENDAMFSAVHPDVTHKVGSTAFGFDNDGELVRIFDRSRSLVQQIEFSKEAPWPCTPNGFGRTLERWPGINDPNLPESWFDGCMGGSPGEAFSPCADDVIVTEINYHSSDDLNAGDWFEVKNQLDIPLDLSGWTIRDDDDTHLYTIPQGTWLPEGGYYVFCENAADFNARFPLVTNVVGDLGFGLGNGGDVIRLYDHTDVIRLSICYNDSIPWATTADGEGYTLELADPYVNLNDPFNWFAGCLGGSPGTAYDPLCGMVGVISPTSDIQMMVAPNPATSFVKVTFYEETSGIVRIMDINGRELLRQTITGLETELKTDGLVAGVYYCIAELPHAVSVTPLIIRSMP